MAHNLDSGNSEKIDDQLSNMNYGDRITVGITVNYGNYGDSYRINAHQTLSLCNLLPSLTVLSSENQLQSFQTATLYPIQDMRNCKWRAREHGCIRLKLECIPLVGSFFTISLGCRKTMVFATGKMSAKRTNYRFQSKPMSSLRHAHHRHFVPTTEVWRVSQTE